MRENWKGYKTRESLENSGKFWKNKSIEENIRDNFCIFQPANIIAMLGL